MEFIPFLISAMFKVKVLHILQAISFHFHIIERVKSHKISRASLYWLVQIYVDIFVCVTVYPFMYV